MDCMVRFDCTVRWHGIRFCLIFMRNATAALIYCYIALHFSICNFKMYSEHWQYRHECLSQCNLKNKLDSFCQHCLTSVLILSCSNSESRPWIVLSGDDDGRSYYLEPLSESADDWNYNMTVFSDQGEGKIVGTPTAFDSDGDDYTEIFVPCYTDNLLKFYTFAP